MAFTNKNNRKTASQVFNQRSRYSKFLDVILGENRDQLPEFFDSWEGRKNSYGVFDYQGRQVYPARAFLTNVNENEEVYLTNVAANAYNDFRTYIERAKRKNKLNKNSVYYNFNAIRGWEDFTNKYHDYIKSVYDKFYSLWSNTAYLDKRIKNFETFVESFIEYTSMSSRTMPITKTGFHNSVYSNIFTSGLVFEIEKEEYDNDKTKIEQYFADPNFVFIVKAAMRFSLRIDYNIPWRFVFDVKSKSALPYYKNNETSKETLFEDLFYKTSDKEIELLKYYLIRFYNSYIYNNNIYYNNTLCARVKRFPIPEENSDTISINQTVLSNYLKIKIDEVGVDQDFYELKRKSEQILQKNDLQSVSEFVNNILRSKRTRSEQ